jgi:hypothetical protein
MEKKKNISIKRGETHIKLSNEQVDEFINMVEEVGHYGEQEIDSFYDKLVRGLSKYIPKRFLKK